MNYKRMAEDLVSAGYGDECDGGHDPITGTEYWITKDGGQIPVQVFADTAEGMRQLSVLCQYHGLYNEGGEYEDGRNMVWVSNYFTTSDQYDRKDPLATYKAQMDVIRRVYD